MEVFERKRERYSPVFRAVVSMETAQRREKKILDETGKNDAIERFKTESDRARHGVSIYTNNAGGGGVGSDEEEGKRKKSGGILKAAKDENQGCRRGEESFFLYRHCL